MTTQILILCVLGALIVILLGLMALVAYSNSKTSARDCTCSHPAPTHTDTQCQNCRGRFTQAAEDKWREDQNQFKTPQSPQ